MNEVNLEMGRLVRDYRTKLNMTQLDLALQLGYDSTQFVSLFERGLSKIPFVTLGKLVVILGMPEKKVFKILVGAFESELKQRINTGKKEVAG
jgi:transcriptional regulator with XRE-family HTH domain